ncbi:MAG: hypothetical protein JST90_02400 [Bacteroidetes bacterium]|nr:hypothetical protein [Bacteroidota bacterium]
MFNRKSAETQKVKTTCDRKSNCNCCGRLRFHLAQLLTYHKLSDKKLGLLINFNVNNIGRGTKRVVNGL